MARGVQCPSPSSASHVKKRNSGRAFYSRSQRSYQTTTKAARAQRRGERFLGTIAEPRQFSDISDETSVVWNGHWRSARVDGGGARLATDAVSLLRIAASQRRAGAHQDRLRLPCACRGSKSFVSSGRSRRPSAGQGLASVNRHREPRAACSGASRTPRSEDGARRACLRSGQHPALL